MEIRRVLVAAFATLALLAAACGSDDSALEQDAATTMPATAPATTEEAGDATATTAEDAATTTVVEPIHEPAQYLVTTGVDFVGEVISEAPDGYFERGIVAWRHPQSDRPQVILLAGPNDVVLAGTADELGFPLRVTDALVLETVDPDVWLGIQCVDPTVQVGEVVLWWESGSGPQVLRLWTYSFDLQRLIELDPSTFVLGSCASPERSPEIQVQ